LNKKVKNIFSNSKDQIDCILIKNSDEPFIDNNFFYVTGLDKGLFEGSVAILYPDGNIKLIISELELETAKKTKAEIKFYKNKKEYKEILNSSISSFKTVGLNFNGISLKDFNKLIDEFPKINFLDASESFQKSRLIKDELEIKLIKEACRISDKVMEKIPNILIIGMKEYELAAEIDYLMQRNGANKSAFETISSFGKNSSEPHYTHGDKKLKKGDFVLCDFGAYFKKYNSDITRTFVFGRASNKQKEMHKIVLDAQKIGFETIKPDLKACDVHKKVSSFIDSSDYKGRFIHSTGHSLGLSVHDGEVRLGSDCEFELKENMVFTVEPGIYLPGYGGVRIEDDVLITKKGIELLSKSPRELLEI
jgi:Xaa-Pro dipeptidase